jgi:hypothetical protein
LGCFREETPTFRAMPASFPANANRPT